MTTTLDTVPRHPAPKFYWIRLRYYASGFEITHFEKSEHHRRMLISLVDRRLAEVVDQGEADWNRHV